MHHSAPGPSRCAANDPRGRGEADAIKVAYCFAVVHAGGHRLAFARQDEALLGCINLAINKARTARLFNKRTDALGCMAHPGAELYGIEESNRGDVTLIGGGLPVLCDGAVIGAIGTSAGTVAQDVAITKRDWPPLNPA
ncbi:heme-binding protein [Sphingomonas sp. GC_Shp_4]|nr:heme-binding protein [Sphingomonas sp. GC_Shp_4]